MIGTPFLALIFAIAAGIGVIGVGGERPTIGGMALAAAALLAVTWVRYAGVMAAGRHYRAGRKPSAWRELSCVPFRGRLLEKSHRAYFHLLRAACLLDREEWDDVRPECRAVLALEDVKAANYATAHGALGQAELHLGNLDAAEDHLRQARDIPHKPATDRLLLRLQNGLEKARS
jgi:hypothetical protein